MSKYQFALDALARRRRTKTDEIDPRSACKMIAHILSTDETPKLDEEELEVFRIVAGIMSQENRNWLSTSQVAIPFEEVAGMAQHREDSLKSRIGLPAIEVDGIATLAAVTEQAQIRHRFLDLISMCIPMEERKRYPHLLTLIDAHVINTKKAPSLESSGIDAATWCLTNFFSILMRKERNGPSRRHTITPDMPLDLVRQRHAAILREMEAAIDTHAWRWAIRDTPASQDSLFAQVLVQSALNRHCLETGAYDRRLNETLEMQERTFQEVSETAPAGLEAVFRQVSKEGKVDYVALVKKVLTRTFAETGKKLTTNVQANIDAQADLVIASAGSLHYHDEQQLNQFMVARPTHVKALLWIMLTWCYAHEYAIANEDPRVHRKANRVISTKSELIVASQDISTLRRMLMTPLFSFQWMSPSVERLRLHARQNSAIRNLVQIKLLESLKGASLAQWEAAVIESGQKDDYLTVIRHAEVGTLMRQFASLLPAPGMG